MAFQGPLNAGPQGGVIFGTFTTAQRNAGVSTATGQTIYNSTTQAIETYTGASWVETKSLRPVTQYFVFTSPGTANLTTDNAFSPDATVDILHVSPGSTGGTGTGGNAYVDSGGASGSGGPSGVSYVKLGQTIADTGASFPVTIPSYPTPVMPSATSVGGPHAGGPNNPGPWGWGGKAGTDATFTISPFAPYFSAYNISNGNGGAATPGGNSSFAGDGGSGGGGGMIISPNGSVPAPLAPATDGSLTGSLGGYSGCAGGSCPGGRGNGGQGYGGGGGGGTGGSEQYGSTSGGAGGGAGAPGVMIIKVSGYLS